MIRGNSIKPQSLSQYDGTSQILCCMKGGTIDLADSDSNGTRSTAFSYSPLTLCNLTTSSYGTPPSGASKQCYGMSSLIVASGGTITYSSTRKIHTFLYTGATQTFTVTSNAASTLIEMFILGGGGGAGNDHGGGGGAGGLINYSNALAAGSYSVTVGNGGATGNPGANGENSVFSGTDVTQTAYGGGGGGTYSGGTGVNGQNGGCGGGANVSGYPNYNAGSGTSGQGYAGGTAVYQGGGFSTGGGGIGGAGVNVTSSGTYSFSYGGIGITYSVTGSNYGGGGSGYSYNQASISRYGHLYGGGAGGQYFYSGSGYGANTAGVDGTGGGGGGYYDAGSSGGSGTVIISYPYESSISIPVPILYSNYNFTFMCRFYSSNYATGSTQGIFLNGDIYHGGYGLYIDETGTLKYVVGGVYPAVSSGNMTSGTVNGGYFSAQLTNSTWYNVVVRCVSGAGSEATWTTYLNGSIYTATLYGGGAPTCNPGTVTQGQPNYGFRFMGNGLTPTKFSKTFSYTGAVQYWYAPFGMRDATIECKGASGGGGNLNTQAPGCGGYAYNTNSSIVFTVATAFSVYVGGGGGAGKGSTYTNGGGAGGWPGGGTCTSTAKYLSNGGGGGGFSAVALSGTLYACAGGGGGTGGGDPGVGYGMGGIAGGSGGANGTSPGYGGSNYYTNSSGNMGIGYKRTYGLGAPYIDDAGYPTTGAGAGLWSAFTSGAGYNGGNAYTSNQGGGGGGYYGGGGGLGGGGGSSYANNAISWSTQTTTLGYGASYGGDMIATGSNYGISNGNAYTGSNGSVTCSFTTDYIRYLVAQTNDTSFTGVMTDVIFASKALPTTICSSFANGAKFP